MTTSSSSSYDAYDPVFAHSRREAIIIFTVWCAGLLWAVPYCYLNGYGVENPEVIVTICGVPSWIFWGILAPWLVADVFTIWFCFFYMQDENLGEAGDEEHLMTNAAMGGEGES